ANRRLIAEHDFARDARQEIPARNFPRAPRSRLRHGRRSRSGAERSHHASRRAYARRLCLRCRGILWRYCRDENRLNAREIEAAQHRAHFQLARPSDLPKEVYRERLQLVELAREFVRARLEFRGVLTRESDETPLSE